MLILAFLYLALIGLRASIRDQAGKVCGILVLVGVVTCPSSNIQWSGEHLHQPASLKLTEKPACRVNVDSTVN